MREEVIGTSFVPSFLYLEGVLDPTLPWAGEWSPNLAVLCTYLGNLFKILFI